VKCRFNKKMAAALCGRVRGGGLEGNPAIESGKSVVAIHWDYHLMDSRGYWRFTVSVPKADPLGFRLRGRRDNTRCMAAYGAKDYLEDAFALAMEELLGEFGINAEWDREGQKYAYIGEAKED